MSELKTSKTFRNWPSIVLVLGQGHATRSPLSPLYNCCSRLYLYMNIHLDRHMLMYIYWCFEIHIHIHVYVLHVKIYVNIDTYMSCMHMICIWGKGIKCIQMSYSQPKYHTGRAPSSNNDIPFVQVISSLKAPISLSFMRWPCSLAWKVTWRIILGGVSQATQATIVGKIFETHHLAFKSIINPLMGNPSSSPDRKALPHMYFSTAPPRRLQVSHVSFRRSLSPPKAPCSTQWFRNERPAVSIAALTRAVSKTPTEKHFRCNDHG